ncbi:Lrp/AsnC family transcriptional regulator [Actinoplanes couchii]|uniref:Lrp/AsnC family transcriptional regulator n=1 Tax=Actinoplanes couchii TaxID=403638 RepID=UPI001EF202FA|nr:Lrp/AsnC family transcriptional regulator [Actinoplanes couchii]MDR6316290.1 DNA-binding Lrp family transcriptional regulator [Actinoplanes couchii]
MDEIDSAIVRELQADARQTNRDLAAAVGIAPSTCLERVRLLRDRGVITGYHADISLTALGREVQALLNVQVRPLNREVIEGFKAYAAGLPEVLSVFVLAGGDDFLVHVAVPSVEGLHTFLMDRFSGRREIIGFRSSVIYAHHRNRVIAPSGITPSGSAPSGNAR